MPPGTAEPQRCSSGLWAKSPTSINLFDAKRATQRWIGPNGEGLCPLVQAGERSCASWSVRLRDSQGLRHLSLLGAPKKKSVFSYFKMK